MKRGLILLPLILAILTLNVLALDVTFTPVQDQVLPGQQAKYVLKIHNNEPAATEVIVKSVDLNWILENADAKFRIASGDSVEFNAVYSPLDKNVAPGKYGANYRIESQSKTKFNDFLPVEVVAYDKVLDVAFVGKPIVDPKRNSLLKLSVTNTRPINLADLNVKIDSDAFIDSKVVNLIGNENDILEFQVAPNENLAEGEYKTRVIITFEGHTFVDKELMVTVGAYNDLQEVVEPAQGFLILGETATLTNNGNSVIEQGYKKKLSWSQTKFTSYAPKPTSIEQGADGYMYVTWDYRLSPGETKTFNYKTNYLAPILWALLFVIIVGGGYLLLKRDLGVTKKVLTLHTTEGNVAIMKVLISVKNNSSIGINDVKVLDKVPGAIKAPVEFGMIKPSSVKNVGDHTALVWDIAHLKKDEEKVISYKIEGRVNLLEELVLPAVLAKFGQGTQKKVFSSKSVSLLKKH